MNAIIPVAGIGTRLRPHTHTNPKVLLPVAGKPILGHILDEMMALGVEEITFIVGYRGNQVVDYVSSAYPNFMAHYVEQAEMLGLGHAISLARPHHDTDQPGLIILGDTIFKADLRPVIEGKTSALGVKEVEDPRRFGVVETDDPNPGGRIRRLHEKPAIPPSKLAIVGIYFIKNMPLLFERLAHNIDNNIRTKNEFQLTDALQGMLDKGERMTHFPVSGWYDCGKRETLLETNRALLDMGAGLADLQHCDPRWPDSVIIPPVAIGPDVSIERSIVGPHVSLSPRAVVRNSIVKDSILGPAAVVENCLLDASVISDQARVSGRSTSLNVGDSSEIDFTA